MPPPAQMRLRITRQLHECIDGIQLRAFRPGFVYEVGTLMGSYLLVVGAAEPMADDTPYMKLPPEKRLFHPNRVLPPDGRGAPQRARPFNEDLATAADRPTRRRKRRLRFFSGSPSLLLTFRHGPIAVAF